MNILHISHFAAPYEGNFLQSLRILEEQSQPINARYFYLFPENATLLPWVSLIRERGCSVFFYKESIVCKVQSLCKIIRTEKINILHLHFESKETHFATKIARIFFPTIKIVIHHHNHYEQAGNYFKRILKNIVFYGNLHIGVSDAVTESLPTSYGQKRITVRNAIVFSRLDTYEILNNSHFNTDLSATLLLMFGYNFFQKGVDLALESLSTIAESENIILMIVLAANETVAAKNLISQHGKIPHWVRLLPPRSDVASYYNSVSVFMTPSRQEAFCYSAVEAAYCGCTLIASDTPGQNELNIPYTFEFQSENITELRDQILQAVHLSKKERAIRQPEVREYVLSTFNINKWADQIIACYKSL